MRYYSIQKKKKMCSPPKMQDEAHSYVKPFYYIDHGKKQLRQIQLNIFNLPKSKPEVIFDISKTKSRVNFNIRNNKICEKEEETVKRTPRESILRQDL